MVGLTVLIGCMGQLHRLIRAAEVSAQPAPPRRTFWSPAATAVECQLSERGVRIRLADPLRFAGRSYLGRWRRRAVQLSQNRISMSLDDRVPGHIGAD